MTSEAESKLDNITELLNNINTRLSVVENKIEKLETVDNTDSVNANITITRSKTIQTGDEPTNDAEVGPASNVLGASHDTYKEFESVKDSVARIALPPWLKIHDSQSGIRQEHEPTLKVISKCGRPVR